MLRLGAPSPSLGCGIPDAIKMDCWSAIFRDRVERVSAIWHLAVSSVYASTPEDHLLRGEGTSSRGLGSDAKELGERNKRPKKDVIASRTLTKAALAHKTRALAHKTRGAPTRSRTPRGHSVGAMTTTPKSHPCICYYTKRF